MSHMSFFILFLVSFHSSLILGKSNHQYKGPKTFIVQIQNDLKPNNISNIKDWYKSIVFSCTNSKNDFLHIYDTVFHGFSIQLKSQQIRSLRARPEVIGIFPDEIYQLHTTRSPYFLGLNSYHEPKGLLKDSDMGSNVVIGVLDTGIWPTSPSFKDDGLGLTPSFFKGECIGGHDFPSSLCNKKIIGVRYYSAGISAMTSIQNQFSRKLVVPFAESKNETFDSALDTYGHGTHTSSTAAGRARQNASFLGYATGEATGMAPKARLAIYKVCWQRGCVTSDVLAGFDQAIKDGVNVISISLGGAPRRYSSDPISIATFGATEKGILVSASGGNSGNSPGSVSNNAPWVTTVAASTIDRNFPADLKLSNGEIFTGASLFTGNNLTESYPIVHFPEPWSTAHCLQDTLDEKNVKGKIVICLPGMYSDVDKSMYVRKAGGVGIIVTSDGTSNSDTLVSRPYIIPGLVISFEASTKLLSYVNKSTISGTMVFKGTEVGKKLAPIVADFSSRGPNGQSIYVLKPDVTAPGVDILAAWPNNVAPSRLPDDPRRSEFNILSGTSMSCPHVSGVAALLKGSHPDWSPAMIKSAMMTTAYKSFHVSNNINARSPSEYQYGSRSSPWGIGAGHVDPEKANDPGLVYDLSFDDYVNFLCASNYSEGELRQIVKRPVSCGKVIGKPWDLNYPAIIVTSELESVVTRTLTNVGVGESSYMVNIVQPGGASVTVTPMQLKFETKGTKQSFSVKVTPKASADQDDEKAGMIIWTDGRHDVVIPVIVRKGELV